MVYDGTVDLSTLESSRIERSILTRYLLNPMASRSAEQSRTPLAERASLLSEAYLVARDRVLAKIVENGNTVEFCPTSNIIVGELGRLDEHPIFATLPDQPLEGINATICTDNPGIFHVSLE